MPLPSSSDFRGTLIRPGGPGWDAARRFHSGIGDPALILRPASLEDVRSAVVLAVSEGLDILVRSGGHSAWGTVPGGATIDLSALDDVAVEGTRVRVGGGARWGDVARVLAGHGLGVSSGDTASVGVGGLTLGGGIGLMVRAWGLACDQFVGAQVVTAGGDVVEVDDTSHPELMWALRGGGGNFGVVTRFDFEAHPLRAVVAADLGVEGDARPILRAMRELMRRAPHELTLGFMDVPAMDPNAPAGCRSPLSGRETTRRRPGKRSPRSWRPRESSNERPASVRIRRCFRRCRSSIRRRPRPASPEATPCCVSSTTS